MRLFFFIFLAATGSYAQAGSLEGVKTAFIIVMENHIWSDIKGSASAPYINNTLLPMSSYCEQYYNPSNIHPSEPNYIWMEAGTNFGIANDNNPSSNHQSTTNHLVTQLKTASVSWKTYQEDIDGITVPLTSTNKYAPKHNPFVYFDDVTGTNNLYYAYALAHIRPYTELAGDLQSNNIASYNYLTPNLCNDMHDTCAPVSNSIKQGDNWLASEVPKILNSQAYQNGGVLFITWDEGEGGVDGPIGMIVLSPRAKGAGYSNSIHYTHGSLLRTLQEIFHVTPFLRDAANVTDLSDLFQEYITVNSPLAATNQFQFTVQGIAAGKTNVIETSPDLITWTPIATNVLSTNQFDFVEPVSTTTRFYRVMQWR